MCFSNHGHTRSGGRSARVGNAQTGVGTDAFEVVDARDPERLRGGTGESQGAGVWIRSSGTCVGKNAWGFTAERSPWGEAKHFWESLARACGEDLGISVGDQDGMLEVGGGFAIFGDDGPSVIENANRRDAGIDHGLDR